MRSRIWLSVVPLCLALAAGSCRKTVTYPTHRRPAISAVVAFPTTLGPGDSTMITIYATDPDGDPLVYDWHAYNGLIIPGAPDGLVFNTASPSMVFHRSSSYPYAVDTAFVYCTARDGRGGSDSRTVLIAFQN